MDRQDAGTCPSRWRGRTWTPWAQAFWDSPEDPSIRIIEVTPHRARYWDAPNRIATMIAMLAGAVTGKQPEIGKSGDVQLN